MPLRCAVWAAVSSEEQARSDKDSIPNQKALTRAKAEELLDFTTAAATVDAYRQLKRLVDAKSISLLIFLNRGRLGRTTAVIESLALYCLRGNVALYDLSAPQSPTQKPVQSAGTV